MDINNNNPGPVLNNPDLTNNPDLMHNNRKTGMTATGDCNNIYSPLRKHLFPWQTECLDIWFQNQGKGIASVVTGAGKTVLALGAIARLEHTLSLTATIDLRIKIVVPKVFLAQQWAQTLQEDLTVSREDIGIYSGAHKDPPGRKHTIYVINSARYTLARHVLADFRQGKAVLLIADECHHYRSPENSRIFDFVKKFRAAGMPASAAGTLAPAAGRSILPANTPASGACTLPSDPCAPAVRMPARPVGASAPAPAAASASTNPGMPAHYYALGLSATPETSAFPEKVVLALGPEIYKYGFADALNDNIISSFSIFNLRLQFTRSEEEEYLELSDQLIRVLENLRKLCPYLMGLSSQQFFATLELLAQDPGEPGIAGLARLVLVLSIARKEIVYRAESRISCVLNLVALIPQTSKLLIFNERIEVADTIYERLNRQFPGQVGRYHSEMEEGVRKRVLRRYQDSEIRILVSCRALDEGLNVPETDVGIIASSTSSTRQRIQRLGRILRRSGKNQPACLYYLYIGSSNEEQELLAEINQELVGMVPVLDLAFESETGSFLHPAYQTMADRVLAHACRKAWSPEIIGEIERNLEQGKLGCDWWNSEENCELRIKSASSRAERNYWITMWLLVQASLNRLP